MQSPTTTARRLSCILIGAVASIVLAITGVSFGAAPAHADDRPLQQTLALSEGIDALFETTCVGLTGDGYFNPSVTNDSGYDLTAQAFIDGELTNTWDVPAHRAIGVAGGSFKFGSHTAKIVVAIQDGGTVKSASWNFTPDYCDDVVHNTYEFDLTKHSATPSTIKGNAGNGSLTVSLTTGDEARVNAVEYTLFTSATPSNKVKVWGYVDGETQEVILDRLGYTGKSLVVHVQYEDDGEQVEKTFTFAPIAYKAPAPAPKPAPKPKPVKAPDAWVTNHPKGKFDSKTNWTRSKIVWEDGRKIKKGKNKGKWSFGKDHVFVRSAGTYHFNGPDVGNGKGKVSENRVRVTVTKLVLVNGKWKASGAPDVEILKFRAK